MILPVRRFGPLILLLAQALSATQVARLSFEELTDSSDLIVSGRLTRSWAAWDAGHKYIWTHYALSAGAVHKGAAGPTVELAEPGGTLDGIVMSVAGAVAYTPGEDVVVFLQRMPNGYLRTAGWGQGRYRIDAHGRIRAGSAMRGLEFVDTRTPAGSLTSLTTLEGMSLNELSLRIAARLGRTR
jgi:hypothetical protein